MVLNVIALFLGIITAAILGAYKDMVRREKTIVPTLKEKEEKVGGVQRDEMLRGC